MSRAVVFSFFCAFVLAEFGTSSANFIDCGGAESLGNIISVSVSHCNAQSTCYLKKKTNVTIEIDFEAKRDIAQVQTVVHGKVPFFPVPVPFPVDQPNACTNPNSGLHCPLKSQKNYTYKETLFVKSQYPNLPVDVIWELKDESNVIVCIKIIAHISS